MRRLLVLFGCLLLVAGLAAEANAGVLAWNGTGTTKLGAGQPAKQTLDGLATINGGAQPITNHISTMYWRATSGVPFDAGVPVTDPKVTPQIKTIITTILPGEGTFAPISGGGPLVTNDMPVAGLAKICLVTGCAAFIPLPLSRNDGASAVGRGGTITAGGVAGGIRVSIVGNPWTLGTGMALDQTDNEDFITITIGGTVHGPASNTSTTALNSGIVQLISPAQVTTAGIAGSSDKLALFGTLRIHFVPEPGLVLLLGSGVLGLALLGRSRMKK